MTLRMQSDDTVSYQARYGRIHNSCEKGQTGVVWLVEGEMAFQGDLIICAIVYVVQTKQSSVKDTRFQQWKSFYTI